MVPQVVFIVLEKFEALLMCVINPLTLKCYFCDNVCAVLVEFQLHSVSYDEGCWLPQKNSDPWL